tara:strand:+ start:328 stop:504 length:177 start_codon:yes stop_codon:yes gene_type:complete
MKDLSQKIGTYYGAKFMRQITRQNLLLIDLFQDGFDSVQLFGRFIPAPWWLLDSFKVI